MPKRRTTLTPNPLACGSLDVLHPNAAGADIGSDFHVVAVAPPGTDCVEVRSFGRLHRRLARPGRLAEAAPRRYRRHGGHRRVLDCVVRPARSQGVPWFSGGPPPDPTGPGPPQERHPGRPVDSPPAQPGSAQRAFRPDEGIRVLRSYLRQRAGLVTECGRTIQHMQKALEQINVKLTEAVSDITGKTGLSIIQAILAGERDPTRLRAACATAVASRTPSRSRGLCKGPGGRSTSSS